MMQRDVLRQESPKCVRLVSGARPFDKVVVQREGDMFVCPRQIIRSLTAFLQDQTRNEPAVLLFDQQIIVSLDSPPN